MNEVSRITRSSELRLQFYKHERKGVRFVINWGDKPNKKGVAIVAASLNEKMVRLS